MGNSTCQPLRNSVYHFHLVAVFTVAPLAMTVLDESDTIRLWNPAAEKIFGWPKEEVMGKPNPIIPAAMESEYMDMGERLLGGQKIEEVETVRQRRDGSLIDVSLSSAPIHDSTKKIIGRMAIFADITQRKQMEAELKKSLAEKEVLLREVYHRTRNNMHVIIALLNMQAMQSEHKGLKLAFMEAENRIYSMALVHEKLYAAGDLSRISLNEYLSDLCDALISSYEIDSDAISLKKDLEDIEVQIDTAIPCGLIANELVSNALKHAYPNGRRGTITVALGLDADGAIMLKVADDGIGVEDIDDLRPRMEMGLQTVVGLGEGQLNGRLRFNSRSGFACELRFMDKYHVPRI